jgi:transcription-repair coupling factor (superfamily II helicase)
MYKKIASIRNYDDEDEIIDEMLDRFGDVPQAVVNLVKISHIRYLAAGLSVQRVYQQAGKLIFQFGKKNPLSGFALMNVTAKFGQRAFIHGGVEPFIRLSTDPKKLLDDAITLLETIDADKKSAGPLQ